MAGISANVVRLVGDDIALAGNALIKGGSSFEGRAVQVTGDLVRGGFGMDQWMLTKTGAENWFGGLAITNFDELPAGLSDLLKANNGRLANATVEGTLEIAMPGSRSATAGLRATKVVSPVIPDAAAGDAARLADLFGAPAPGAPAGALEHLR